MSVLIIEDDASVSHLIATLLRRQGIESVQVFRGDVGFEKIDASGESFDAIILDLLLPVVSGFEIIDHIAAVKPGLLGRVVVISAAPAPALQKLEAAHSLRAVIRKPFELDALLSAVTSCVDDSRNSSANQA